MDKDNISENEYEEHYEIDLNELFCLNYSFDKLKSMLSMILKKQKKIDAQVNDISSRVLTLENKRNSQHHFTQTDIINTENLNNISSNENNKESILTTQKDKQNDNKSVEESKEKQEKKVRKEIKKKDSVNNEKDKKKVNEIKINTPNSIRKKSDVLSNLHSTLLSSNVMSPEHLDANLKNTIAKLTQEIENHDERIKKMSDIIDNLSVKMNDFDIYQLFKDVTKTSDPNTSFAFDAAKALIENVDKKTSSKFVLNDEKIKKLESESFKAKNDIIALTTRNDSNVKSLATLKNDLREINESINEKMKQINSNFNKFKAETNNNFEQIYLQFTSIKPENEGPNEENNNIYKPTISENVIPTNENEKNTNAILMDMKEIKKIISKKIGDYDKKLQNLIKTFEIEKMWDEIEKIKQNMINKEQYEKDKKKLTLLHNLQNAMQDDIDKITSDNKTKKNIIDLLSHKIETLTAQMALTSSQTKKVQTGSYVHSEIVQDKSQIRINLNDFATVEMLNSALRSFAEQIDKLKLQIDGLHRLHSDTLTQLNTKCEEKDLRQIEVYIDSLVEELKNELRHKYNDKFEINKQNKVFDLNFKKINEAISRLEINFNANNQTTSQWLIAKKPISNLFMCASCESVIDIDNKDDNLKEEKGLYNVRNGNGFSRILSMVNLNSKIEKDFNETTSRNFMKKESDGSLPKLNNMSETDTNFMKFNTKSKKKKLIASVLKSGSDYNIESSNLCQDPTLEGNIKESTLEGEQPKM